MTFRDKCHPEGTYARERRRDRPNPASPKTTTYLRTSVISVLLDPSPSQKLGTKWGQENSYTEVPLTFPTDDLPYPPESHEPAYYEHRVANASLGQIILRACANIPTISSPVGRSESLSIPCNPSTRDQNVIKIGIRGTTLLGQRAEALFSLVRKTIFLHTPGKEHLPSCRGLGSYLKAVIIRDEPTGAAVKGSEPRKETCDDTRRSESAGIRE
jgi:hypothetical protein